MFPGKGARRADAGLKISMTPDSAQRIFWELSGQKILCHCWCGEGSYGTKTAGAWSAHGSIYGRGAGINVPGKGREKGGCGT